MRTFTVKITTKIDEASTTEEQILDQKEYEIQVDRLLDIEHLLSKAAKPWAQKLNLLPKIPQELEGQYEFVDFNNCEGFNLSHPEGRVVIDLGDGRALMGLTEWSPSIKSGEIADVALRMYFARKKEAKAADPPKVFGKKAEVVKFLPMDVSKCPSCSLIIQDSLKKDLGCCPKCEFKFKDGD